MIYAIIGIISNSLSLPIFFILSINGDTIFIIPFIFSLIALLCFVGYLVK